jgi:hypothetical protein
MECIELLNYSAVVSAFMAALFWFLSAFVKGKSSEERDETGMLQARITINGGDLSETLKKQSKFSAIAAVFAGISALLQGLVILLG